MDERLPIGKPVNFNEIRIHMESKLGWKVTGPFYIVAPIPKVEYVEKCAREIEKLVHQLLETVIIEDNFNKNHSARREYKRKNPDIDRFSSKYSKLKGNTLLGCLFDMERIIKIINKYNPLIAQKLNAIAKLDVIGKEFNNYNKMEFREKVAFARKLDNIIYQFLLILSEK